MSEIDHLAEFYNDQTQTRSVWYAVVVGFWGLLLMVAIFLAGYNFGSDAGYTKGHNCEVIN